MVGKNFCMMGCLMLLLFGCSVFEAKSTYEDGKDLPIMHEAMSQVPVDSHYVVPEGEESAFDPSLLEVPNVEIPKIKKAG